MNEEMQRNYYNSQSKVSDPREFKSLYVGLSSEVSALTSVVQGIVLDKDLVDRFGLHMGEERLAELDARYLHNILERLQSKQSSLLTTSRAPDKRFIGSCRDYALVLCSLLRYQGVPARLRFGFATYFSKTSGVYSDHCVCEYWDSKEQRWILVDPNLDPVIRTSLDIKTEAFDLPRDQFVVAADAWKLVRSGKAAGDQFGVQSINITGTWFIRGSLMRDLAAFNKVEMLPWDYWGLADCDPIDDMPASELPLLDTLADALTAAELPTLQALYERSEFQIPTTVTSFSPLNGLQKVTGI